MTWLNISAFKWEKAASNMTSLMVSVKRAGHWYGFVPWQRYGLWGAGGGGGGEARGVRNGAAVGIANTTGRHEALFAACDQLPPPRSTGPQQM